LLKKAIFIVLSGYILLSKSNMALGYDTKPLENPKKLIWRSPEEEVFPTTKHYNGLKANIPKVQLKQPCSRRARAETSRPPPNSNRPCVLSVWATQNSDL